MSTVRFLSDEWLKAMVACSCPPGPDSLVLQQHITGTGPDVSYWLAIGGDGVEVGEGQATKATVTFRQTEEVAAAIHAGERSALNAFLDGDLDMTGQIGELTRAAKMLAKNDPFAELRERTTYDG